MVFFFLSFLVCFFWGRREEEIRRLECKDAVVAGQKNRLKIKGFFARMERRLERMRDAWERRHGVGREDEKMREEVVGFFFSFPPLPRVVSLLGAS